MADKKITRQLSIFINGKEVKNSLGAIGREIGKVKRQLKEANDPKDIQKYKKELSELRDRYSDVKDEIQDSNDVLEVARGHWDNLLSGFLSGDLKQAQEGVLGLTNNLKGTVKAAWAFFTTPLGATLATLAGIAAITKMWVGYNIELYKTTELTRTLTGLSGEALEELRDKVSGAAKTFDLEYNEVLKASNAYAKQMKISHTEAIDLITQGLARGANINGDFLDKLKQYPVQFKNAGFSAQDFIDIATQEVKGGVYSDKLVDTLKEADLALKDMTKTQTDALENAFGKKFTEELAKGIKAGEITTKEAIFRIINEADTLGLNLQQKQQIISDVFKGAGEDVGGFSEIILQLNESFKEQNKQLTENEAATLRLAEANQSVNSAMADLFDASQSGFPSMLKHIQAVGKETFANLLRGLKLATTSLRQMISVAKEEGATAAANDVVEDMKRFDSSREDAIKYRLESTQKNIDRVKKQLEDLSFTGKLLGTDKTLQSQLSKYIAYKDELLSIASDTSTRFKDIEATYINPDDPVDDNNTSGGNSDEKDDEEKLTKEDKRILESKKKLAEFLKEFEEEQKIQKELEKLEEDERAQEEELLRLEQKFLKMEEEAGLTAEKEAELSEKDKELKKQLEAAKLIEVDKIKKKYEDKRYADKQKDLAKHAKLNAKYHKKMIDAENQLENARKAALDFGISNLKDAFDKKTGIYKALFVLEKALAVKDVINNSAKSIAQITANTGIANAKAIAASPLTGGLPWTAINTAIATKQIAATKLMAGIQIASIAASTVKGFKKGGYTGNKALYHDGQDGVVGPAHVGEWYAPKWMNESPKYAPMIQWLEKERKSKTNKGFFNGGHTAPEEVPEYNDVPTVNNSSDTTNSLLLVQVTRLNNLLENGIEASAFIGDDKIQEFEDRQKKLTNSRENAKVQ
ncbi:phage tail tape measure protein [Tenacibaculum singaporense]|uniref:phage tail tape measure protein n=1 Tax=Tenacibaculum singaporense TaxID=2358479 RepID=UPI000F66489E|nr:phage tail tape measure protein [Tenacibaculum singaporense]RSC96069.1 hypothetical protein EI424_02810 [Tenacibaculum singaporense]